MLSLQRLVLGAMLLSFGLHSQAHHSYAMFDTTRPQTVEGTVKSVEWVSPHVWLWVMVGTGDQEPVSYGFESLSPGQLLRDYGWDRHALNIGDKITVTYNPLKSGRPGGGLVRVNLANGKTLETRFSKPQGQAEGGAESPKN
jgi:hypothetical protein